MKKFAIIVSKFNDMITDQMLKKCIEGFNEQGIEPDIYKVPGAFEIPIMAQEIIKNKDIKVIVALGVVIKGETEHFEMICNACTNGINKVALKYHAPIVFEVIMTDSYKKAEERIEKAFHAAYVATEMARLIS